MSLDRQFETEPSEANAVPRVVVALDSSPQSVAALRAAAELASLLGVELEGLFVEDVNLQRLCGYPSLQEVGSYTGAMRHLDDSLLQRQMRTLSADIRQAFMLETERLSIDWSFRTSHGAVVAELLAAARTAMVLSLGRASRRKRQLGSTALSIVEQCSRPILIVDDDGELCGPFTVVYTGGEESRRTLDLALNIQSRSQASVRVLVCPRDPGADVSFIVAEVRTRLTGTETSVSVVTSSELAEMIASETGTLLLPRQWFRLLEMSRASAILVP